MNGSTYKAKKNIKNNLTVCNAVPNNNKDGELQSLFK
jgi:hypothetical protein